MFTVFGASGFIGSNLCRYLETQSKPVRGVRRGEPIPTGGLGHVVYCIGMTADFRKKPFETIDAHVTALVSLLRHAAFDSFLFLSSTRVYARASSTCEDVVLGLLPQDPSDLYNASKVMGEAACLTVPRAEVRVARLSNVYGSDVTSENFLSAIVRDAVQGRTIRLQTALDSEKDYVCIDDVVASITVIAERGAERVYNIGSGLNVTHAALCAELSRLTGCAVSVNPDARAVTFPPITIDKIRNEFAFTPRHVLQDLGAVVAQFRKDLVKDDHDR